MYQSPINIITRQMQTKFENDVFKAVQEYGVAVDKDELIKALNYDRNQYEQGYRDGLSAQRTLTVVERIFDEIDTYMKDFSTGDIDAGELLEAIDKLREKYTKPITDDTRAKFIKALRCCCVNRNGEDCDSCPYLHGTSNTGCVNQLLTGILNALEEGGL